MRWRRAGIAKRIFLVGCSRSGTTLLQVMMAGHQRVHSFPETGFFLKTLRRGTRPVPRFGRSTGKECGRLRWMLARFGRTDLDRLVPGRVRFYRQGVQHFVKLLDHLTVEVGKDIWLEKTPRHIFFLDQIARYAGCPQVIHIVRDGRDVVASMRDRALKYPEQFGTSLDPLVAIDRWNRSLQISLDHFGRPGHCLVVYEQLVAYPDLVLPRLCEQLGIDFQPSMLDTAAHSGPIVPSTAGWLQGVNGPVRPACSKFESMFDTRLRRQISRALNLEGYQRLCAALQQQIRPPAKASVKAAA